MIPSHSLYERLGQHAGIQQLVASFYSEVRQHLVLGPIFKTQIRDWDGHLTIITEFWALQTGGKSKYGGGFANAHQNLGLDMEHFQIWLALWEDNNLRRLPAAEAAEMNQLASQMADRLLPILTS